MAFLSLSVREDYLYNQHALGTIEFFLLVFLPALAVALVIRSILRRRRRK